MTTARSGLVLDVVVGDRDVTVRLEVAHGETLALLGPNGAGKSTVLGAVAGLVAPTSGHVVLDGRDLTGVRPHRRHVALLAQDPLLFPHLSVLDNVAFAPRSTGAGRSASRSAARAHLREVGVEDLADRRPDRLSGGQAQRVAVARALAADPAVLLLDEPMAALDVDVVPALRQVLRRSLADRTVLLVTHDPLDALLLADRVVVLERGRVVEDGATQEVLTRPRSAFAARIAGLNLVAGRWDGRAVVHGDAVLTGLPSSEPLPTGGAAVAVFSPAAVSVYPQPPSGSPRNALAAVVTDVEPLGDRVRVTAAVGSLTITAEVTPSAAADLELVPGAEVHLAVKAVEVAVHAARRS
ncbi:MAG: ABC transporter ATP-binding protein [Aeromicrobium sp.]|uniref:sulfate/molybdate ABC transporter ATP-binding protein n=1 Tax=Aeromicrobium sp. TaxID=1871063 RepID=UPI002606E769|nr:ABC transporter ATP-binding protein [Aeromicrobium sp.]MDF1703200.1 ABC transporter ATP-binding protein [Aeromicrobium sp.]